MRTIQIYGQQAWHDQALILSDRDGLLALKGAIERLLDTDKKSDYVNCYVSDGEGYHLFISKIDDPEEWNKIDLSYSYEPAKSKDKIHPYEYIDLRTSKEAREWKN